MKRFFLCFLAVSLAAAGSVRADETVRAAQTRLKTGGFYFGEINGRYNSDTSVAITRYQIRNGLQITGKLDAATSQALGVSTGKSEVPLRGFGEEAWRSLRKSDQEYLKRLVAADARKTKTTKPPEPASNKPPSTTPANYDRERLSDYIAAFVLAGLDPQVGAETEFFAERVNYFGKPGVSRETIRRDLQRYNDRWPQRAFSLAGELEISSANDQLRVSFPLHYELRNASKRSSGKVHKTLVLEKTGTDDLQIVSVDERKAR
ncbi:MAG: N-acetylmuramoyl-L-alanine amidase [Verrucomicrobiota bacterium]|jgi:peptidoglycan hydrolase-like protein with peptidoglycan-binding domain